MREKHGCLGFLLRATLVFFLAALIAGAVALALTLAFQKTLFTGAIALIRLEEPIYSSRDIVEAIAKAGKNNHVKALLLRIDSPGGAVGASEEIYREVLRVNEERKKPVIVSMGNVAASGGYYVALAANEIYANTGTITGSIGVIATDFELQQLLELLRIKPNVIKSGEHKDTGSPLREMTTEERQLLQRLVFNLHRQFVREVIWRRHTQIEKATDLDTERVSEILATTVTKSATKAIEQKAFDTVELARETGVSTQTVEIVKLLADGRIFTGEQAYSLGLIDRIGNLEDARKRAAQLAGVSPNTPLTDFTPRKGLSSFLGIGERLGNQNVVVSFFRTAFGWEFH
jgi:protease-4